MIEHRIQRRYPVYQDARVFCRGEVVAVAPVENISDDGLFLRLTERFRCGTPLETELRGRDGGWTGRRMAGLVVHSSPRGVGVMFTRHL